MATVTEPGAGSPELPLLTSQGIPEAEIGQPLPPGAAVRGPGPREGEGPLPPITSVVPETQPLLGTQPGAESASPRRTSWKMTSAVMLGEMFGVGALALPAALARLGWLPGLLVLGLVYLQTIFAAHLMDTMAAWHPDAKTYHDFGTMAFGAWGRRLVCILCYPTQFNVPIILQLTAVEALKHLFHTWNISRLVLGIIVAVIMLPLVQVRRIDHLAWVSLAGTLGMVLAVAVAIVKLAIALFNRDYVEFGTPGTELVHEGDPRNSIVGVCDIIFAFAGAICWPRYIASMQQPLEFSRAATLALSFMFVLYVAVACLGYSVLGADMDLERPLTSVLHKDAVATRLMNAGLLLHCLIAYQIDTNISTYTFLSLSWPRALGYAPLVEGYTPIWESGDEAVMSSMKQRLVWGVVSSAIVVISFVVALLLPYFASIIALIAAIGDTSSQITLPALFALSLLTVHGEDSMDTARRALCSLLVVVGIIITIIGVYSAAYRIILLRFMS